MKYIIRHKKSIITGILLVLTLIAGWIWLNRKPETAAAGWWNDNWSYRKAIVINHAKVAGDLVNFPMLVSLTDTNLGSHAQADGDDIVFIVSNGEKLKHEIESFATTTGALVAWVKMPTLSSTADQTIYMYYGNGGVGNQEETSAVWDENYVGVWHMADATGASSSDSTSYGHNGTIHDSVTATSSGKIDGGLAFSPGTDRIAIGTSTVLDNLQYKTIEGWIKVTDQTGSGVILGKIDTDNTPGWSLSLHSSEQLRYIHSFFTSNGQWNYNPSLTIGEWYHIAVTYDFASTAPSIFINGSAVTVTQDAAKNGDNNNDENFLINIGNRYDGNADFENVIGDLRLSNTLRSAAWIQTEYNNQNDPATFLAAQTEETGPGPIGHWSFDEGYGTTAHDQSGQGNNGTITGAVWQDESMCLSGKCLYFDGSGDYVDIAPDPAIEAADDDKYTWSVWVRPLDVSTQQIIMSATDENGFGDGNTAGEFNIGRTSGTCEWTFGDNGDNTISVNISTSSDWQHWVGVKNGLNIDFYINGFLRGSKTNAESGSRNPLSLRIGSPHAAERFFHGFLDEVKIYPYARTADQIKQDYAAGLAGIGTPHGIAAAFGSKSDNWMSDGLVGYWKFDEPAGTYDDDGDYDDAIDSSGNGITGDADMSASTTAGKYGNSLIMESGDAMYYGDNLGFESNNPFSIFLWLNTSYDEAVILRKMVDGETYCGYQIYLASSDWRVNIRSDDTTDNTIDINGLTDFGDGEWHYVGFTYDGSSRAEGLKLYVDGENDNGSVIHNSLNGTIDNDAELALGMGVLAGRFDEVRIYNRALSPDEIRKLYEWAPGPVAYWKFDEHTGTTAFDSAASTTIEGGNHGTLTCDGAGCTKPTWVRGKYGGALNFSANTSDEDRVTFPGDGIWDDIPDAFTAMAWVKIRSDGGGDQGRIIDCGDSIGPFIFQMDATNNPGLQVFNNDGYEYHDPDDCDECIPLNEWHHIAATWVAGTSTFYLDGINIGGNGATYGYVYGNLKPTSGVVAIGNRPSSTMNRDFDGAIDEIKIYTYARTQKQILQDMAGSEGDQTLGRLHPALELHFDEGKGGTAYDSSGYGNNGTLYPGTTGGNTATSAMWDLNGKFGKAIEFDGTNDYISISDNSSLDIGATNSVSVAAWVRVNSWGADEGIVCKTTGSGSANVDYCLGIQDSANDDGFEFYVGSFTYRYSYPKKSLNTWYHVIGTYDGSNIYMYINGEREDGLTAGASKSASNAAALEIGRWYTRYFHGLVDSAQVFPYVLTATEAKALYNQSAAAVMGAVSSATTATSSNAASRIYCVPGSTDYCVPPVGEWTFNEKTGTTTYDTSGNGNDGVFVSAGTSPTWQAAHKCRYGSCLEFDGSDDYAQISADSTIDDMATATISMWFNLSSVAGGSFIVKDPGDTGAVNIYPFPDQRLALTRKYSSSHMEIFCPVSSFSFNKWTHLSATYAGRYASNARIYLNGVDCGQVNDNGEGDLVSEAGDPLYIGRLLTGFLDQVRIYNYARTPAQIAWEYNRGEPVAWWDFNECQGGTIHDQSYNCKEAGTCNHGTLILGSSGVTATGTCASSSSSTFWGSDTSKLGSGGGSFDGESDYIDLGIGTLGYQYLSVSAWFKYINYSSCDGWDGLVSKDDGYDFILGVKCGAPNINNVVIWMSNTVGGSSGNIYSTTVVNDSTWHHALATFNGSKVRLYIDGEFENEGSLTGYVDDDSDARMTIGSYDGGESLPDRFMKGNIDEVKIWNYALTAEQVKTEYAGGAVRIGE